MRALLLVFLFLSAIAFSQDKDKLFIDQLQNGEEMSISYRSNGCFHGVAYAIVIGKKDDHYYTADPTDQRILTDKMLKAVRTFEKEYREMENSFNCTTHDKYSVSYKGMVIKLDDGSCSWSGGHVLMKALGWSDYAPTNDLTISFIGLILFVFSIVGPAHQTVL